MPDPPAPLDDLGRVDRRIGLGEARIALQTARVEELRALGQDIRQPEAVLREMDRALAALRDVRAGILNNATDAPLRPARPW